MKATLFTIVAAAGTAAAQQSAYGQCGGQGWTGSTTCVSGYHCNLYNPYYAQCIPGGSSTSASAKPTFSGNLTSTTICTQNITISKSSSVAVAPISTSASFSNTSDCVITMTRMPSSSATIAAASTSANSTSCNETITITRASSTKATSKANPTTSIVASGASSVVSPVKTSPASSAVTSKATPTSSTKAAVSTKASTSTKAAVSSVVNAPSSTVKTATTTAASSSGKVQYAGVNIAGFDFGCGTDGTCTVTGVDPPGTSGIAQMKHFVTDDGLNAFRLPVAWQYLVNNNLGGTLDATYFANYDSLVQGCLSAGAEFCLVDVHNYARWNGEIIGQGGPTNAQFASLWSQIATKYADNSKVAFGIMNEPHDLDISEWAVSAQAAVTAIRQAGATSQKILVSGTDYTGASSWISDGSGAALLNVTNLDGSTDNLIFDVHQYLDSDDSGTSATCTTNNVAAFQTLGEWLRTNKRQAMLTETGGGSDDSTCLTNLCEELAELNTYSDVFLGWVGWAAGSFATSYVLSETPTESGGVWTDQPLVKQCIVGQFK